jgi:polygalacturonase
MSSHAKVISLAMAAFALVALAAASLVRRSPQVDTSPVSVTTLGATGNGVTNDGPALQLALNSAATNGRAFYFPCGTYLTNQALFAHSNTELIGADPGCAVIKAGRSIVSANTNAPNPYPPFGTGVFLLTNYHWVGGDSNIVVHDLGFDLTNANGGGNHNIHFYNASHIRIDRVSANSGGDGIAGNAVSDVGITNSQVIGVSNGGLDFWDGSSDIVLVGNKIYCSPTASSGYGILFTGANTNNGAATTHHTQAIGNYINGCYSVGIWAQGNYGGATTASFIGAISGTTLSVRPETS